METHFAYLAAMIDGEGTITILRHMQHNRPQFVLKPRLLVSNTNREMLEILKSRHGGQIVLMRAARERCKEGFFWRICSLPSIRNLLLRTRPYMIIKARHADEMLAFTRSRLEAAQSGSRARYGYSAEDVRAFETIHALNKRGAPTD